mgnify:CR=1 FL=1
MTFARVALGLSAFAGAFARVALGLSTFAVTFARAAQVSRRLSGIHDMPELPPLVMRALPYKVVPR